MIASLRGIIQLFGSDHLVLETGGIGFLVYVPRPLLSRFDTVGEEATLLTYLVVREDALTLYGFDTLDQRSLFETLLSVTGVGPRVALNILSSLTPDDIRTGVAGKDSSRFSRISGIGKKLAERLILELSGKLDLKGVPTTTSTPQTLSVNNELIDLLVNLGYSSTEAQAAVVALPADAPLEIEERLRLALRYFGGV
jgi:Holliday junction DNA helicase RuvA